MFRRVLSCAALVTILISSGLAETSPRTRLNEANTRLQQGDLAAARTLYESLLDIPGAQIEAHRGLARLARREDDLARAISQYEAAIQLAPGSALLHAELGMVFSDMRQHARAVEQLREATRLAPSHADLWRLLGETQWRADWYEDAIDSYRKALSLDPSDVKARIGLGDTYLRVSRLDEAIRAYDEAIALDGEAVAAFAGKGAALSKKGKYADAIDNLIRALRIDSDYGPAYYELGLAYQHEKQYRKAIIAFTEAAKRNPFDAAPFMNMARSYARLGQKELAKKARAFGTRIQELSDALMQAEAYIATYPKRPDGYAFRAKVYRDAGDVDSAIREYERALGKKADYLPAWRALAELYLRARDLKRATEAHRRLLDLAPGDVEARITLGLILLERGENVAGQDELERAYRRANEAAQKRPSAEAFSLLAYALYALQRYDEAQRTMREAIRLNPSEPAYRERLATIEKALQRAR